MYGEQCSVPAIVGFLLSLYPGFFSPTPSSFLPEIVWYGFGLVCKDIVFAIPVQMDSRAGPAGSSERYSRHSFAGFC